VLRKERQAGREEQLPATIKSPLPESFGFDTSGTNGAFDPRRFDTSGANGAFGRRPLVRRRIFGRWG
jgi:hypothetical protein